MNWRFASFFGALGNGVLVSNARHVKKINGLKRDLHAFCKQIRKVFFCFFVWMRKIKFKMKILFTGLSNFLLVSLLMIWPLTIAFSLKNFQTSHIHLQKVSKWRLKLFFFLKIHLNSIDKNISSSNFIIASVNTFTFQH